MPTCPPIPPPPSLFAIVGPDQNFVSGSDWTWPNVGYLYWIAAVLLLLLVLAIVVWVSRAMPKGRHRLVVAVLLALGALAIVLPAFFLLLVGWPGTKMDTLWWFHAYSTSGGLNRPECLAAVDNLDHQHTQARDVLNTATGWALFGGVVLFPILTAMCAASALLRPSARLGARRTRG